MGRFFMYATIGALAFFVLSATFVIDSGGGSTAAVAQVSVHNLRASPETYRGRHVTTEGTLRFAQETARFALVDDENQAVAILKYDSHKLRELQDRKVSVAGRFGFDAEIGIYIEADTVSPLD